MDFDTITLSIDAPVATLTLNRPDKLNAISLKVREEIVAALDSLNAGDTVRVIRLKATGRAFCAGYDLDGGYSQLADDSAAKSEQDRVSQIGESEIAHDRENLRKVNEWLTIIRRFRKPIIAQVQGLCLSGGLDLIGVCDGVWAASDARFGHPASRALGIPATLGLLPVKIGPLRTKELLFTGDLIDAEEAERWGLINRAVDPEELEAESLRYCRRIALLPLDMLTVHKEATNRWIDNMGYQASIDACVDLDAVAHLSPYAEEFARIAREASLKAALEWRDGPFQEQE